MMIEKNTTDFYKVRHIAIIGMQIKTKELKGWKLSYLEGFARAILTVWSECG